MASPTLTQTSFHVVDYVIMIAFLLVSMVIGFYFGVIKKQRTTEEYLLGGRKMKFVPVAMSLLVTFQSAISVMGTPMEVYAYDTMMFYMYVGACLAMVIQLLVFVPLFHPLKLISVYEYLDRRFESRAVQLLGTYMGMTQTILYMAVVLYAPALALEAVAGIPLWLSVVVVGMIGTLYTSIGGIKSVIWTDVFQFFMLYGGLLAILIMGGMEVGRFGKIVDIAQEGKRLNFSSHSLDPRVRHTLWSLIIGGIFNWLPVCCNQSAVQRIGAVRTEREAKMAVLLNIPMLIIYGTVLVLVGMVLYAFFQVHECGPLEAGFIATNNQIVPYFVMHVLSTIPGLAGIFLAALFSGALSSLSSGINSLAANTIQDILVNYVRDFSMVNRTLLAKFIVCVYGTITIGLAYSMKELSGSITQISLTAFGATGSPVVGMMLLGAAFPHGNWIGAFTGGFAGIVFNIWLAVSCVLYGTKSQQSPPITTVGCFPNATDASNLTLTNYFEDNTTTRSTANSSLGVDITTAMANSNISNHLPLYDISYLYLGLTGLIVSTSVGVLVSLITGKDRGHPPDQIYILPFLRKFWNLGKEPEDIPMNKGIKLWQPAHSNQSLDMPPVLPQYTSQGADQLQEQDGVTPNSEKITDDTIY